jgi:beta-N-acetylhexosaminidase
MISAACVGNGASWTASAAPTGRPGTPVNQNPDQTARPPDYLQNALLSLTLRDKVGQLFMLGFSGSGAQGAFPALSELRAGGIILVANATDAWQATELSSGIQQIASDTGMLPPLISIDHEGGRVQRIRDGVTSLGSNWDLGRAAPAHVAVAAACSRGQTHGRELASLGIRMNLAPVLDVVDNPRNSVIGDRSYGDDPQIVSQLGAAYIDSLQREGVLAVAKHFPGHGSTTEDSHLALPVLRHDRQRLDGFELVPFRSAIQANVAGIMTAHVGYTALEPSTVRPASLSAAVVSGVLRAELGFDGVVITDDLAQMRAITDSYEPAEAAVQAILAGSDMLLVVGPFERQARMVEAVTAAVGQEIGHERLDASVLRILKAKQRAGLLPGGEGPSGRTLSACEAV